jgi:hypothetical protein
MSTVVDAGLAWFPLVPRPRPPGLPLEARVAELLTLTASTELGSRQELATRAAEVLNKAALIASDCGIAVLARGLCRRQYELLARSAPLPGWAVRLAMQPVLNIPRQLIRDGHGDNAHALLETLHAAALSRATAVIDGMRIDFGTLTSTTDGRKEACMLTWTALLADGTRALAQAGRWKEAAGHAAAYRGTGARLLDGRQATILALLADKQASQAAQVVEQSTVTEPWEHAVQAVLRVLCQQAAGQDPDPGIATMITATLALAQVHDLATAVARARIGLTALDLAGRSDTMQAPAVRAALITAGNADAYVARDLLASQHANWSLTSAQRSRLQTLVRACGLDAGVIPGHLHDQLTTAVGRAEAILAQASGTSREEPAWPRTFPMPPAEIPALARDLMQESDRATG